MHPFELSRTDDPAQASAAHAVDPQLAFIAGGTDLIGLMKDRAAVPDLLDINGLPNMAEIDVLLDGGLRIGALARMSDVAADMEVRRRFLSLRRRCYSPHPANCATCPSDLAVALAALDAIVRVKTGERRVPFTDFHRLPGNTPERDNVLDRGDLIIAIEVPASAEAHASYYLKVRDRASYEFALVSAAAAVATDGRCIHSARLAMGGVAHRPWRLRASESGLHGISLDDIDGLRSAIVASFVDARPLAHNAFKVELAQRVALRALQTAGERL